MDKYRFKRSFDSDATLSSRLFYLLETTFPGISSVAQSGRDLGASWEAASTPFILFDGDLAITHVGVLEIPMIVMGKKVTVGGVHAVCTHPEFRRRGYYRQVMTEVMEYCDRHYETLLLTTSQPELYSPFGFRVVEEHAFIAKCSSNGNTDGFRLLNIQDSNDRKLLHRLLEEREPVSNIVGVTNEKAIFCFNEGTRPLHYAEDLDIIVCIEIEGRQLKVFDLVGKSLCNLNAIVERIKQPIDEVVMYFSSDRIHPNPEAFPHIFEGDSLLMVRGEFSAESVPFMLPRSARC